MARFTEEERVEVWDRWQAGDANRLMVVIWDGQRLRSGRLLNRGVGCVLLCGDDRYGTCLWWSARRSRAVSLRVTRCGW